MLLKDAISYALATRWHGLRVEANIRSRLADLERHMGPKAKVRDVTNDKLATWVTSMRGRGLSSATMRAYLMAASGLFSHLKANGMVTDVPCLPTVNVKRPLQWWLNEEQAERVYEWTAREPSRQPLADLVRWTILTGLRIEETLRVSSGDFIRLGTSEPSLYVPGTKTEEAGSTIAISLEAAELASRLLTSNKGLLFGTSYKQLQRMWTACRTDLGITAPTATLKALRRTAARTLTVKGMPQHVLQTVLRHRSPNTTRRYLELTGGYSEAEQRKWI